MEELELFRGTTVLSMEQATTLPFLTYRLAADGMDVIRIEHPRRPDPNRFVGEDVLGEGAINSYFLPLNLGKRAITLDLADDDGRAVLEDLMRKLEVDIFATNLLEESCRRVGVDYATLRGMREDLIWIGITGFGPEVSEAAYDPVLQARAGFMDLNGDPDGDPMVFGLPVVDLVAGEHAYAETLKALFRREGTGLGSRVDVSMFQSAVSWLVSALTLTMSFGRDVTRKGNTHRFFAPVSVFGTRDGHVYIAVGNDRQWESLTGLPGFGHLARPEYERNSGRIADVENLNRAIGDVTRGMGSAEIVELLGEIRVPASRVNSVREVASDPYVVDRIIRSCDARTGMKLALPPLPVISRHLESLHLEMSFPPRLGEHNEEIYGGLLGYGTGKMERLRERGVI